MIVLKRVLIIMVLYGLSMGTVNSGCESPTGSKAVAVTKTERDNFLNIKEACAYVSAVCNDCYWGPGGVYSCRECVDCLSFK